MPKRIDGKTTSIFVSFALSLTLVSFTTLEPVAFAQTYTDAQGRSITKEEYDAGQLVNEASQLLNQNKNAEALFRLESAVRIAPNMPDAHYNYGIALAKMGQTEEAVRQYQEASRLNPQMPYAWMNLGASYQMLGKIEEAVQAYTEFVTRFPSNPEAGKLRNLIQGLNKELGRQTNLPAARPPQQAQAQQAQPQQAQPQQAQPQQAQQAQQPATQSNNFQPINATNNFQPIGDGSQGFAAPQKAKTDWSKGSTSGASSSSSQPGLSEWQGSDSSSSSGSNPSAGSSSNSSGGSNSVGLSGWQGTDSSSSGGNSGGSQGNFQPVGKAGGAQGNFQPIGKAGGAQGDGFQPLGNVKTQGGGFQPIGGGGSGSQANFQPIGNSGGSQGNFQPIGNVGGSQGNFQPIGNPASQGNFQPIGNVGQGAADPSSFGPPDEAPAQPYQQQPPAQMQQPGQRPNQPPVQRPQVASAAPRQNPSAGQPAARPTTGGGTAPGSAGNAASNYLNDVGGARLGRWPSSRMPLKVCIIPAANVKGYQPAFDQCLIKCFQDWGNCSGGKISFKGVSDPKTADIVCTWTSDTSKFMNSAEAGETTVYGSQAGIQHVTMLVLTVPHPMSPSIPVSENRLRWICLHEIGHALGLGGHTRNPQDIMFFTTPLADVWKDLTPRDCNTIQALYSK
jgi:predicted Zn-dependent protease/Tfp pilus assembly protein PilF